MKSPNTKMTVVSVALGAAAAVWGSCPELTSPTVCCEIQSCPPVATSHCTWIYCSGWQWSIPGPKKITESEVGTCICQERSGNYINGQCVENPTGPVVNTTYPDCTVPTRIETC